RDPTPRLPGFRSMVSAAGDGTAWCRAEARQPCRQSYRNGGWRRAPTIARSIHAPPRAEAEQGRFPAAPAVPARGPAPHSDGGAVTELRSPYPWFGGKRRIAELVW